MNDPVNHLLRKIGLEEANKHIEELKDEVERLQHLKDDSRSLLYWLKANKDLWIHANTILHSGNEIHIEDPIHHQVSIEAEIAPIFYHSMMQRLALIKQLSFSYLTFPTSTHTRLSHSLGVCKNVELSLTDIFRRGILYTSNGIRQIDLDDKQKRALVLKAKVAALLHDLGHGPFGHGLDQYITSVIDDPSPDKFHSGDFIRKYLGEVVRTCDLDPEAIIRILGKKKRKELEGWDNLISNIIDSPSDVDRMDYLVRDAHMTGLSIGTINVHAMIARMIPFEEPMENENGQRSKITLLFDESAIPYITHLLYARDSMYLNCYEHPTKVVAEKMLIRAVDEFRSKHSIDLEDLVLLTDEELLRLLLKYSDRRNVSYWYANSLMKNLPFEQVFSIYPKKWEAWEERKKEQEGAASSGKAEREEPVMPLKPSEIIEHWETERISYKARYITRPKEWEETIAKDAGLSDEDRWKVLVTVPSVDMAAPKFDDIKILIQEGGKYTYCKLDQLTGFWEGVLKHMAVERYCIRVFVSSELPAPEREKIRKASESLLSTTLSETQNH